MVQKIMWLHSHITNASGSSKYLLSVISELSKKYEITLYLLKPISFYKEDFEKLNIQIISLSDISTSDPKFWINFSKTLKNSIKKLSNDKENFDMVISSFFPMNIIANSLNLPHLQFCFQPYVFFWNNDIIKSFSFHKVLLLYILKTIYSKLDYTATQKSKKILTINEGSKKEILEVYGKESIPTFMGIDDERNLYSKADSKEKRGKKIILHTTDWSPSKKTFWLIDQFEKISAEYNDVELLITETKHDPKIKSKALSLIKEKSLKNIKFLGILKREKLFQIIKSSNIVVYPGSVKGITTSLFILECMACGIPPIVHYDTSEDVNRDKSGYVFSSDSEFRNYVLHILKDSHLEKFLGNNAQEYVLKKFTWKNVINVFEKNIQELIR